MITREHLVASRDAAKRAFEASEAALAVFDAGAQPAPPPAAPTAAAPAPPATETGLTDPGTFFARIRAMMGGSLTETQVEGINAILDACAKGTLPLAWTAYVLATPALETGNTFDRDKVESLNYSADALIKKFSRDRISLADARRLGRTLTRKADEPGIANTIYGGAWGLENLGNTHPNDGWHFRGRTWPQITGRRNYTRADKALGLDGQLLVNPALISRPDHAAGALIRGMVEGWYTGKTLAHYLRREADLQAFKNARYIINGQDRAEDIAKIALAFQDALRAGGWR